MRSSLSDLFHGFAKIINSLIPKDDNSILFIPHKNCINDQYDIINYSSDNALVVCHNLLTDSTFDGHIFLVYYDKEKKEHYDVYLKQFKKNVDLIDGNNRLSMLKAFFRCKCCCTCHAHYDLSHKINKQKVICLGYFSPFKDDYYEIKRKTNYEMNHIRKIINHSFSWHIVTSDICGRIIACDTLLSFSKMISLGFPRNDIFYKDNGEKRAAICKAVGVHADIIICYTPTYRDYERLDLPLGDKNMINNRTLFGSVNHDEELLLAKMLEEKNAVIIVKLHPWQEQSVIISNEISSRIFLFSKLQQKIIVSLYDILSISDCLITDYTSTVFDYLHADKPILFYMYDYDKYMINRGFSYNPISSICCGPIAYDFYQLLYHLKKILNGIDEYIDKRMFVHALINKYRDGNSYSRIQGLMFDEKNKF